MKKGHKILPIIATFLYIASLLVESLTVINLFGNLFQVQHLFNEIHQAFINNLDSVEWMDEQTRAYALEKAEFVTNMLGYPDYIKDQTLLDKHYENVRGSLPVIGHLITVFLTLYKLTCVC